MAEATDKKAVTDEIATIAKDIDIYAGWLKRLENPDPVLRAEAAGKGLKLYDEVDRDAHAGSVLQQRIMAVVGKEWEIIPAKNRVQGFKGSRGQGVTEQDQIVADYVSGVLENCNFDQARQEILKAILYGFYVAEIMWQTGKPGISIKKLVGKHPRRFSFTVDRELRLLTLQSMFEGEPVPDHKFIVYTYGDSDNPYGSGLGRKLWWPVWFKKNGVKFWLVFLEKFGMPTVMGKYPSGTTPAQQTALMDAIDAIQSDTGIKIPDTMDVGFLEASRAGAVSHEQLCDYMDRQISKAVLGQTLTTEIKGEGSYAASQTHNDVRQEILEADADLLDSCFNETLIPWIVDYNFPNVTAYPKILTYAAPKPDLVARMNMDKIAVDIGIKIPERYFYETYGYPSPEEGESIVQSVGGEHGKIYQYHLDYGIPTRNEVRTKIGLPPVAGGDVPARMAAAAGELLPQFAEGTATPDAADLISDRFGNDAMNITDDAFMAPLKRLVDNAKSMKELRDGIIDLYSDMNPAELGALMERAMMTAELMGRYEVKYES